MFLFLPSNPAHYRTMEPVARELSRLGHRIAFSVRDAHLDSSYSVDSLVRQGGFTRYVYEGFYKLNMFQILPPLGIWHHMRKDVFRYLDSVAFNAIIVCNDFTVPFERLAIDYCRRNSRVSLLIQESVRPAFQRLPLAIRFRSDGPRSLIRPVERFIARRLVPSGYGRSEYGHSPCSLIAVAGDAFRRRLISEGVDQEKIHITGQPRLDQSRLITPRTIPSKIGPPTLLFCSQPSPVPQRVVDMMFVEMLEGCRQAGNVQLLVKLHPRDLAPEHWFAVAPNALRPLLIDVTKTDSLESCFEVADAMVTIASTTCLEAMQAGLPVGLIKYLPLEWHLPYEDHDAIIPIRCASDFSEAIRALTRDEKLRQRLVRNAEDVLFDELYLRDGKSAQRIAQLLLTSTARIPGGAS